MDTSEENDTYKAYQKWHLQEGQFVDSEAEWPAYLAGFNEGWHAAEEAAPAIPADVAAVVDAAIRFNIAETQPEISNTEATLLHRTVALSNESLALINAWLKAAKETA